MPFGKDLSHLIEEQISKAVEYKNTSADSTGIASRSGVDEGRIAQIEANLQRLAEKFSDFLGSQKKSKRNVVYYGLNVIALHDLRLAVTGGRAIFIDRDEPLDLPYTYLQLSSAGSTRQIRYVYLDSTGVVLESTTDPTNIGTGYLPLAMVDVWSGVSEITQDKITDLRPREGADENSDTTTNYQLTGNATLYSPDTGNDSFVVAAINPAGLKINITSGRALVDGELLNAEGGLLDLINHRNVDKEFVAFSDGVTKTFNLYHQSISDVVVYVEDVATEVTVDAANGSITFTEAPAQDAKIEVSYTFSGNYMLLFLVEKVKTNDGKSFGVIGWKVGSSRSPSQPPDLASAQHAIAKVDMSSSITAITDAIVDNSYEVKNLTQYDLQYGGKLGGASIQIDAISSNHIQIDAIVGEHIAIETITGNKIAENSVNGTRIEPGSITGDRVMVGTLTGDTVAANTITGNKIAASTITGDNVAANTITGGKIVAGTITGDKVAANAITGDKIAANTITGGKIVAGTITGDSIAANAITGDKIAANAITSGKIVAGAITGDTVAANAITGDNIAANTITGDHIITGSIDSANIKAGAITSDRIATGAITADHIASKAITADMINAGVITADKFESSTWGDMSQAMRFVKTILGGDQAWRRVLSQTDLNVGEKYQVTVTSDSYPAIRLDTVRHWDDTSTWDTGNWDIPVYPSGHWVSASMDYGTSANLQAEFWGIPVNHDPTAVTITVKAKYCKDNLYKRPANVTDEWQDYADDVNQSYCETLSLKTAGGYYYWVGSLREFRYFKFKVIFQTSNTNKYTLLASPEVRAANCQIGSEDISDGAVITGKLANGAITAAKMATGALGNNISILTGSVGHGGTIPLPTGYSQAQCRWIVSFREMYFSGTVDGNDSEYCFTDANRVVYVYGSEQRAGFVANYIIVGIK
jgi:hypothetical protein